MKNIITCIDGSVISTDVCHAGVWVANKLDKTLLLVHAIEKSNTPDGSDLSGAIGLGARSSLLNEMASLDAQRGKVALAYGKELLEEAQKVALSQECKSIAKTQRHSGIVEAICDLESEARFIVIGRSGEGHPEDFKTLGSHIEQVIRQVHTPVLIVNRGFKAPSSFMLAYDGRETADKAVQRIIEGGLLHGMTCHLVSVKNKQANLEDRFIQTKEMLIKHGFEVKASLLEGNIFETLSSYKEANNVEMVVMGAFSHSKLATVFLGSNTQKMLGYTQLPLVILR